MSDDTYTRIVQFIVFLLLVLGLIYAEPFDSASARAFGTTSLHHNYIGRLLT